MSKRNRNSQISKRKEIEDLLECLWESKPVPNELAISIAERIQLYIDGELDNIEDVLCRRERNDKLHFQPEDLAEFVNVAINYFKRTDKNYTVTDELFRALEIISEKGEEGITSNEFKRLYDEDELEIFFAIAEELDIAREAGAITNTTIKAYHWQNSYKQFNKL